MYVKSKKTNVVYVATQKSSDESAYAPDFPDHGILPGFELQNHATEETFWIEAWKLNRYKVLTEAEVESSYHLYLHKIAHPDTPPEFSKLIITDSEDSYEFTETATHNFNTKEFTSMVFQFSEPVTLRPGATHTVTVGGEVFGTLSQHSTDSLLVTPTDQNYEAGEFTFTIAGDVVQDSVGQLVPETSLTITFVDDRSVPEIETITFDGTSLETEDTHEFSTENIETVTVELTEPVTLVPDAEAVITVDGTQWGTFEVDGSTLTVTPDSEAYVAGEKEFVIAADTLQSAKGKANAETTIKITFVDDRTAPYAQNLIFIDNEDEHTVEDNDTLTYTTGTYTHLIMNVTPGPISLVGEPETAIVKDDETPWGTFTITGDSTLEIVPDDGYDYPADGDIEFVIDAGVFEHEGKENEAISITVTFADDTPALIWAGSPEDGDTDADTGGTPYVNTNFEPIEETVVGTIHEDPDGSNTEVALDGVNVIDHGDGTWAISLLLNEFLTAGAVHELYVKAFRDETEFEEITIRFTTES